MCVCVCVFVYHIINVMCRVTSVPLFIKICFFVDTAGIFFDSAPAEQTYQLYTDALIECRVSANPEATVTWRFNNQRIVLGQLYFTNDV